MQQTINLQDVFDLGKELIPPRLAAINLQIPNSYFLNCLNNTKGDVHKYYFTGYLETKKKLHKDVIECNNTVDENKMINQKLTDFENSLLIQLDLDEF